jgi:hypothetical protein
MADIPHVHVRKMEIGDFEFVRELAAQQSNFTVPPPYVLWLLLRIKGAITLIAEDNAEGPLSYLLAVPIESPADGLYIWQLATKEHAHQSEVTLAVLEKLRGLVFRSHIQSIAFSAVPDSPALRVFRIYASKLGSGEVRPVGALPLSVEPTEGEYHVDIRLP